MTTIHFCFRVMTDRLEPVAEDQLPRSIQPGQAPTNIVMTQEQRPEGTKAETEQREAERVKGMAEAADAGRSWLIATVEDFDPNASWLAELKEKAETEIRKDPDMYARYQAGGGFQPGRSLQQWREHFGGDEGEWIDPMSSRKVPVSLAAWAGRDPEQTYLTVKTRTYWHVFDA